MLKSRNAFLKRFRKRERSYDSTVKYGYLQFLFFSFLLQINIEEDNMYNSYLILDSPGLIFLIYILLSLLLAYPLMITIMFFGYYTNRQILGLFEFVPLFKGIGYMVLLSHFINFQFSAIHTVNFTYLLSYWYVDAQNTTHSFLYKSNSTPVWYTCEFERANEKCFPLDPKLRNSLTCSDKENVLSLTQFIYRQALHRNDYLEFQLSDIKNTNPTMIGLQLIHLYLILIALWTQLRKLLLQFLIVLETIGILIEVIVIMSVIILCTHTKENHAQNIKFQGSVHNLDDTLFWAMIISHASNIINAPRIMWLGTIMPEKTNPHTTILLTFVVKLSKMAINITFLKFILNEFINYHQLDKYQCQFYLSGDEIRYTIMFDVLGRLSQPYVWVSLYAISKILTTWVDNAATACIILIIICDEFKAITYWPMSVATVYTIVLFLLSLILFMPFVETMHNFWHHYEYYYLLTFILVLTTVSFNFIYSIGVIANDYFFKFNSFPTNVMMVNMNLSSILALYALATVLCSIIFDMHQNFNSKVIAIGFSAFCASPLLFLMIKHISLGLRNRYIFVDRPLMLWGPKNTDDLKDRKLFIPHRDFKYRRFGIMCRHNCLHKAQHFNEEKYFMDKLYFKHVSNLLDRDHKKYHFLLNVHEMDVLTLKEKKRNAIKTYTISLDLQKNDAAIALQGVPGGTNERINSSRTVKVIARPSLPGLLLY